MSACLLVAAVSPAVVVCSIHITIIAFVRQVTRQRQRQKQRVRLNFYCMIKTNTRSLPGVLSSDRRSNQRKKCGRGNILAQQ